MRSGETNCCADMTMELLGDRHQFNHINGEKRLDKSSPTPNFVAHSVRFRRRYVYITFKQPTGGEIIATILLG
jgi:hypothetical protein